MAATAEAVAEGRMTAGEAAEFAKVVDAFVRAYRVAELDDRATPVEQLTTAELMRIAAGGLVDPDERASKLLLVDPR